MTDSPVPGPKRSICRYILILWIVFFLFSLALWLKIDNRPPRWDESASLLASEFSYQRMKEFHLIDMVRSETVSIKLSIVSLFTGVSFFVVGHDTKLAVFLLNAASFTIIFVSMYFLGILLFNRLSGLFGSVIVACYPGMILWSKYYMPDVPLTAAFALSTLLMIWTERKDFLDSRLNGFLGLTLAIGICVKHLFIVFLFIPLAYLLLSALYKEGRGIRRTIRERRSFFIFVLGGVFLGSTYHLLNLALLFELIKRSLFTETSAISFAPILEPLPYLLRSADWIFGVELKYYYAALLLIGFVASWFKYSRGLVILYLSVLGVFVPLLFVVKAQMPYYFFPALPALALISFSWTSIRVGKGFVGHVFSSLLVAAGLTLCIAPLGNFLEKNFGTENIARIVTASPAFLLNEDRAVSNPFADHVYWDKTYVDGNVETLPYPHYWYMDEMLDSMLLYIRENKLTAAKYKVGSMTHLYEWMAYEHLQYKIWQRGLNPMLEPISIVNLITADAIIKYEEFLKNYDFIILKTGRIAKNDFYVETGVRGIIFNRVQTMADDLLRNEGEKLKNHHFVLIADFPLPDGSKSNVWASTNKINNISLLDYLSQAIKLPQDLPPSYVAADVFNIGGDLRSTLLEHPVGDKTASTQIIFPEFAIKKNSVLKFGIAIRPDCWGPEKGDGVHFAIYAKTEKGRDKIFGKHIDPKKNAADRKWFDYQLPLDQYSGQKIRLVFETNAGENNAFDHSGWSAPTIVVRK